MLKFAQEKVHGGKWLVVQQTMNDYPHTQRTRAHADTHTHVHHNRHINKDTQTLKQDTKSEPQIDPHHSELELGADTGAAAAFHMA